MTIAIRGPRGGRTPNAARNPGRVGLVVVAATASLLLAACGSGPSQAGSAAIVGNTAITLDSVQQELSQTLTQPDVKQAQADGQLDQVSRGILTNQIMHQVTAAAAARYGINVTDADVDAYIAKAGGLDKIVSPDFSAADRFAAARDEVIEAEYAAGYLNSLSITIDYFEAETQADALTQAKQVAEHPGQFSAMVTTVTNEGGYAITGEAVQLAKYVTTLTQSPGSEDLAPLFAAAPGTVVVLNPTPGQSTTQTYWYVMRVDSRTGATRGAAAAFTSVAEEEVLATVGAGLLRPVADSLNVQISPRYGLWDSASMQVVADESQATVFDFPSGKASGSAQ